MNIKETQLPEKYRDVIEKELDVYRKGRSIQAKSSIPDTKAIPIENRKHWLKIPDVVCVFVDMVGSTRLSAYQHDKSTAGAYQLFTETAVRLFSEFESPYIDVRGDGAFALFNSGQEYRAIAATVSFKTFSNKEFEPRMKEKAGLEIGAHIGVDRKTLLVRKVGLKRSGGRSDRQNEVWAGKPVNMAAKLAAVSGINELRVSDRFFAQVRDDLVRLSCGCPGGEKSPLWTKESLEEDDRFDFDTCYRLDSVWCGTHGSEYCDQILKLDED